MVSSVVDRMHGNLAAFTSLYAHMQSNPFGTLTEANTRSKSRLELNMQLTVDVHDHQHTLEDQHGHYASVCCWFDTPKKTMFMLENELDGGATPMH